MAAKTYFKAEGTGDNFETIDLAIAKAQKRAEAQKADVDILQVSVVATVKYPVPAFEVVKY